MPVIQIQYGHYIKEYLNDSKNYRNGSTLGRDEKIKESLITFLNSYLGLPKSGIVGIIWKNDKSQFNYSIERKCTIDESQNNLSILRSLSVYVNGI